jgi:DNA-binding PadR family transcriptional regulator
VLAVEDAALYQALHVSKTEDGSNRSGGCRKTNRRAKYYQLTAVGRRELRNEVSQWKRYAEAVFKAIQTA